MPGNRTLLQTPVPMTALEEAKRTWLPKLSPLEKRDLLRWLEQETQSGFPGIELNPGVCGGKACIAGTRIPVWGLEEARRLGSSEADLLLDYPSLRAEDLANAWAYVAAHEEEVNEQIRQNAAE